MRNFVRAARISEFGTPPRLSDSPRPIPQPGQILVKIRAAALNFADLLKAEGKYQERAEPPFVPGLEGAGEVLEAPAESGLSAGNRVAVLAPGTMAEVIATEAGNCLKLPDNMSFEQAAGFQIVYGTSHMALDFRARLQRDETLVVLGAAGGVGLTAVEIGKEMGARVIAVARGRERLETVRQAGADEIIDSNECEDLKSYLRELGGADAVYDPVGSNAGEAAFGALHRGGRYLVIGFAGGKPPELPLNHALVKNIAIHGLYWGGYSTLNPQQIRTSMSSLFTMFDRGRLRPVNGVTLPFERIAEGFELLRERRSVGKIIITM